MVPQVRLRSGHATSSKKEGAGAGARSPLFNP
jgi:hypothetical protein